MAREVKPRVLSSKVYGQDDYIFNTEKHIITTNATKIRESTVIMEQATISIMQSIKKINLLTELMTIRTAEVKGEPI